MATWAAIVVGKRSVISTQSTNDSAPTLSSEGMSLQSVAGFTVTLEADAGQTLSGAGTLACYTWEDTVAGWSRLPDTDITIPASVASNRRYGKVSFQVQCPRGRVAFITSGVTVSAGNLTLYMVACDLYGNEA